MDALKRTQIHWKLRIVTLTQRFTQRRGGVRGSETAPENPNPLEAWDLGLIQRFAQRRGGGGRVKRAWGGWSGEGIKRWGIEGISVCIGTSDRFGRGRGEFCYPADKVEEFRVYSKARNLYRP